MTDEEHRISEAVTAKLVGRAYRCDDCGHIEHDLARLKPIKHYNERVAAEGPFPDGECPACRGALCYEIPA